MPDEDHDVLVGELRDRGWGVAELRLLPSTPDELYPDVDAAGAALDRWVADGVDVVIAFSTAFAQLVAERAPEVKGLFLVNDPVAAGLVDDPRRPAGSITGVTFRTPADRTLDLARRTLGPLRRLGYLFPVGDPGVAGHRASVETAAAAFDLEVVAASFDGVEGVPEAVDQLAAADVDAVLLANATGTFRAVEALGTALDAAGLPTIANTDVATFAVLVVTPDGAEVRRQLARQAARLLAGAEVASVPVEDPRKFVVILNRTKAEALGLPELEPELLRQVDVVR